MFSFLWVMKGRARASGVQQPGLVRRVPQAVRGVGVAVRSGMY